MRVVVTSTIPHRPEVVFDAAAHPEEQLKWDPETLKSVEKLTPGPLARGARYRGNFKGFGIVDYEFTEFDEPHRFTHLAKVKLGEMRHEWTFEPDGEGTRLTQVGELRPNLLGRVMSPMAKRMFGKRFALIASELDRYLESGSARN